MPTTVVIDSVTTEDAAPTVAPHRISDKVGFSVATVKFTVTHDGNIVPGPTLYPSPGTIAPTHDGATGPFPDDPTFYPDEGALIPGVSRDTIAWIIREGGTDAASGKPVEFAGSVCSAALPCSTRRPCSEWGIRQPSGHQFTVAIPYADANDGAGDGTKNLRAWALTESQGWS